MARKKRRAYGQGTVWQNKKGEWFARFPIGNRQYRTVRVASEQAGEAWLEGQRQQRIANIDLVTAQTLVSDGLLIWLNSQRKQKPKTLEGYKDLIEYYILDFIEGVRYTDLRRQHVMKMIATLHEEGKSPAQIRNAVNLFARALNKALADDLIPKNYAALVKDELPALIEYEAYTMSAAEVRRFFAAIADTRLTPLYHLAILLGLRKGELLGLRWPCVDFDNLTITIDQQAQYVGGKVILTTPKTPGSVRTLPITPAIADMLHTLWQRLQEERERLGVDWKEHGLVFPAENGKPKWPRNLIREFKEHLIAAHVALVDRIDDESEGYTTSLVRFHDLRHTAATRLGEAGAEEYVISSMLGHGKANVTRKYARATLQLMRQAIEEVERRYWKAA